MMNDDTLRNIEYLREKADVSYEDAADLLEAFDGNVMRVLVELERQGRVYPQGYAEGPHAAPKAQPKKAEPKKQTDGFLKKAMAHRLVVESGTGEKKQVIANLSAPYCAGAALVAPWLALGSAGLMFVLGYRVKVEKGTPITMPEDMETFVDKAVDNIKKTASSVTETIRAEKNAHKDDDDEGGEITIE